MKLYINLCKEKFNKFCLKKITYLTFFANIIFEGHNAKKRENNGHITDGSKNENDIYLVLIENS